MRIRRGLKPCFDSRHARSGYVAGGFIERPVDIIHRARHAFKGDFPHEFLDLRLSVAHLGTTGAREASRLLLAQDHGALVVAGGIAGRGFDRAFQNKHLSRPAVFRDHAEFRSQVHDVDARIGDAESHRFRGHIGLQVAALQNGLPCGIEIEYRRTLERDLRATIESDLRETGFQLDLLAAMQFLSRLNRRAGPTAIFGAR
jgi:hypothetical protein